MRPAAKPGNRRVTASALLLSLAWGGLWAWGAVPSPAPARPAITEGLLHYWPNLWDAHDEVTGREGVVMGLLPPTTPGHPDDARFDDETGYVQLPVAIPTDGAWTISCWMRADYDARWSGVALALISGVDCWWLQHRDPGLRDELGIVAHGAHPATGPGLVLPFDTWVHLALSKAASGRVTLWRDGVAEAVGDLLFPAGAALEWIVVGNDIKGDVQWTGHLQDLGVFDRVLAEADLRALRQAGRSGAVGQNRPPRQAAQQRTDALAWSTDWRQRPVSELSYRRYTAEDGLPANNVACLWQARDGALWVGTDAGLARFDGRRFRVVTADDTPEMARVGSSIQSLAEAPDGTIWAGVYGGLLRIRGVEVTGFTEGLTEGYVLQAVPEADGSLWVAGFRLDRYYRGPCRVRRFHPDTGQTTASVVVPGHVRRLVPTPEGLWMATEDPVQLLFWDRVSPTATVVARWSGTRLTALRDREPTPGRDLQWRGWRDPANTTRCVVEARVGPDGPSFHWVSPTHRQLTSVSRWPPPENRQGWLGAEPGLFHVEAEWLESIAFPDRTLPFAPNCLSPNREGGVWIGTTADGLHFLQEKRVRVFTTRDGLSGDDVRSVLATREGTLLVGGPSGLDELHGNRTWQRRAARGPEFLGSLRLGWVSALAQDAFGTVWVGLSQHGFDALRYLGGELACPLPLPGLEWMHPTTLAVGPTGRLWIGCNHGITWFEPAGAAPNATTEPAHLAWRTAGVHGRFRVGAHLPDVKLLKLLPAGPEALWAGTAGAGLLYLQGERVRRFTAADGLPDDTCVPGWMDEAGALWVVARGAVARWQGEQFQVLTGRHGIPRDLFHDLIPDERGGFWLPGERGIHRLDRTQLEDCLAGQVAQVQSLTLGVRDGLLTPACTPLHYPITARTPDGRVWVATRRGVASFDPRQVDGDTDPLPAFLEQVVVNHEPVALPAAGSSTGPWKLPPGSGRRLEFHYTAISLVAADRVRFQHRLEGYDADWSPENDLRLAFYTNLRPGNYRFQVRASNAHGVWNPAATELAFVIAPHLWQRRSVQVTAGLLALLVALLLHRQRVAVLRHLQALEHQQELASERARIAADMHDDLGASLTQIAILGEMGRRQLPDPVQTGSLLARISQSSRDVAERISDLVWATNPRHDRLDNLAGYVREQAARLLEGTTIEATLRFPERLPEEQVSATFRRNVLLVVKEALHNALKHASPRQVVVEFVVDGGRLHLRIEDDGRGFDAAPCPSRGNGLLNMPRRIHDLGGSFELDSAPGRGTRIRCSIPLHPPRSARTA